jgi:hypothetical protein
VHSSSRLVTRRRFCLHTRRRCGRPAPSTRPYHPHLRGSAGTVCHQAIGLISWSCVFATWVQLTSLCPSFSSSSPWSSPWVLSAGHLLLISLHAHLPSPSYAPLLCPLELVSAWVAIVDHVDLAVGPSHVHGRRARQPSWVTLTRLPVRWRRLGQPCREPATVFRSSRLWSQTPASYARKLAVPIFLAGVLPHQRPTVPCLRRGSLLLWCLRAVRFLQRRGFPVPSSRVRKFSLLSLNPHRVVDLAGCRRSSSRRVCSSIYVTLPYRRQAVEPRSSPPNLVKPESPDIRQK